MKLKYSAITKCDGYKRDLQPGEYLAGLCGACQEKIARPHHPPRRRRRVVQVIKPRDGVL